MSAKPNRTMTKLLCMQATGCTRLTQACKWNGMHASGGRNAVSGFPPVPRRAAVRALAGVSFYVVILMKLRFAGEARQVILAAMCSNIRNVAQPPQLNL
jgi:hypothetical protein